MSRSPTEATGDRPFAANDLPLGAGIHLLEASAGTGKTFALAHLVLRLVSEREISLRRLLVVTFTEAAAAELKDRIAQRLQQALAALNAPGDPSVDADLGEWLERWDTGARPLLHARLLLALEELDASDITTIHGFSRRTLMRQALEAGLAPELKPEREDGTLLSQIVHDYWQEHLLPLPLHLFEGLRSQRLTPQLLQDLLGVLPGDPSLRPPPLIEGVSADRALPPQLERFWEGCWQRFREHWEERGAALAQALKDAPSHWKALGAPAASTYPARPRTDRAVALQHWLQGQPSPGSYGAVLKEKSSWLPDYFHPGPFSRAARRAGEEGSSLPERPLMEAVAALVDGPWELTLAHFSHWGLAELERRRRRMGRMGFGDLLRALDPGPSGQERTTMLSAVGRRYDVALIDEFQDTDPIQWRILRRCFGGGEHLLVMVGDPKQAIYRFRGGDLGTYLGARESADSRQWLDRNFRSAAPLLDGLNRLMRRGLSRSSLAVPPLQAWAGQDRGDLLGPGPVPPLQLLWLGGNRPAGEAPPSRTQLERTVPATVGSLVLQLLGQGLQLRRHGRDRPLEPADLCLLVSRHDQAESLRGELERHGIASRLISRADVFASEGATLLQRLLDALAEPGSDRRLRLLASSPLLGWSPRQLAEPGDAGWEALAERASRLASRLRADGVLAALAELLGSEELAYLSLSGRLLADLQQCAELVQEHLHQEQLSPAASAAWLRRRRLDPPATIPDEHQSHSGVADSAVGVVTVHSSKGLEFPVVICPYLWQASGRDPFGGSPTRTWRRWTPPGATEPVLDLHRDLGWGEGLDAARQECDALDAEAERLAYVALTRAQHLLVLGFGPAAGQARNPLVPWLFPDLPLPGVGAGGEEVYGPCSDADWLRRLDLEIERRSLPMGVITADRLAPVVTGWQPSPPSGSLGRGPVPAWPLATGWGRSSYSSWTHATGPGGLDPIALEEGRETDALAEPESALSQPGPDAPGAWAEQGPLARFPRGAAAGDCLHRILERVDHRQPGDCPAHRVLVGRELQRAGLPADQIQPVLTFLEQLRSTPLGGELGGFQFSQLAPQHSLREMSFDLPLAGHDRPNLVRATGLARAFREHPGGRFGGDYAERLSGLPVASRGFLTGSIDLVFTAPDPGGHPRWWVADWKSNWLGLRGDESQPLACGPLHYDEEAMTRLMVSHHYPLQSYLYLVALHRYLGWRLPGYRPDRDLGGFVEVFLRGVPGPLPEAMCASVPAMAVPGMLVEAVQPGRLHALDTLLREGQP